MAMKQSTIIVSTIIAAPSSTKNEKRERDPEMHQTCKGKQWHFGMKVHIGVDSESGLIYSVETTAVNVHDLTTAHELLHGEETVVYADAGYQAGLIQSVAQPPWSGLRAWCEVGGITSSLCPKPFLPQPTST